MNKHYAKLKLRAGLMGLVALGLMSFPEKALAQLNGTAYTINATQAASATNFRNFQSFFNVIAGSGRTDGGPGVGTGVSGSVEVNVAANQTFNEQVTVNPSATMNANRRVLIKGNNALLTFDANTTNRHTLWLNGADFFTFDNLRIEGRNASFVYTVRLSNQADYNIFRNCEISAPNFNWSGATITLTGTNATSAFTNTASASAIVAFVGVNNNLQNTTSYNNGRGNLFENNRLLGPADNTTLIGPTYGIFEQGNPSTLHGENDFINNEIKNISGIGIYSWSSSGGRYNGNKISRRLNSPFQITATNSYFYGIWIHYPYLSVHTSKNIEVNDNTVMNCGRENADNARYFYGIAVTRTNGTTAAVNSQNIILMERNMVADNYYYSTSTTSAYFYGIYTYYTARAFAINNVVANNKPFNLTGTTRYSYYYPFYFFYSKGGAAVHNTTHLSYTLPNQHFFYNYGMYIYDCCAAYNTSNNWEKVSAINNIAYFDIRNGTGTTYYSYANYFYYLTEMRNNAMYVNKSQPINAATDAYYVCYIGRSTQCNTGMWDFPSANDNQDITGNIGGRDYQFVDAARNDFRFLSPELNATGRPLNTSAYSWFPNSVFLDFNKNPRNPNAPDIGAYEVDFDYGISGQFNNGNYSLCGGEKRPMTVRLQNFMAFPYAKPLVGYKLNNNNVVIQEGTTLPSNGTVDITFDQLVDFTGAPENSVLKVFIAHPDDKNNNDTLTFNITVGRGPFGGVLSSAASTKGLAPTAERTHWITIPGDPIVFNITSPSNYANNRYNLDYAAFVSAKTVNSNITLPAAASSYTHNVVTGGTWSFNPPEAFVDSMVEIELRLRDFNSGCDTFVRRQVLIAPFGKPNFKIPANICVGNQIEFENEASVQSGYLDYEWDFGNGTTSKQTNGRPVYAAAGTYQVTLKTTTVPYGFVKSITKQVTVNDGPVAAFDYTSNCFGSPVVLTNKTTSSVGTPTYAWDFGNGQTSGLTNPTVNYSQPGMYTVKLTASRNGCQTVAEQSVAMFEQPKADFVLTSGSCANAPFMFENRTTNVSGKVGYKWSFGESNSISTQEEGEYVYKTAGNKSVKLVVTTPLGCRDSITKNVAVIAGPSASFTVNGFCQNGDIVFQASDVAPSGVSASYNWNIGGNTAGSANTTQKFASVGTRMATLEVQYNNGCFNTMSKEFEVNASPKADFAVGKICANDEVAFENKTTWTDGSVSYNWEMGTLSSTATHPSVSFATAGTVNVKLRATAADGCSDEVSRNVVVNPAPSRCAIAVTQKGEMGYRYFEYAPSNGSTTGAESGVTYTWYYGDGRIGNGNTGGVDYAADGSYTVTMRATTAAGCFCESTQQVVVDRLNTNQIGGLSSFVVYPNPSTGLFKVELGIQQIQGKIEVLDAVGSVVFSIEASDLSAQGWEIDLSDVSNGLYLVRYSSGQMTSVRKVQVIK